MLQGDAEQSPSSITTVPPSVMAAAAKAAAIKASKKKKKKNSSNSNTKSTKQTPETSLSPNPSHPSETPSQLQDTGDALLQLTISHRVLKDAHDSLEREHKVMKTALDNTTEKLQEQNERISDMIAHAAESAEAASTQARMLEEQTAKVMELTEKLASMETEMEKRVDERNVYWSGVVGSIEKERESVKAKLENLAVNVSKSLFGDVHKIAAGEHWVPDATVSTCSNVGCNVKFSLVTRKHHCRACGGIFCSSHASKRAAVSVGDHSLVEQGLLVRVCDSCIQT